MQERPSAGLWEVGRGLGRQYTTRAPHLPGLTHPSRSWKRVTRGPTLRRWRPLGMAHCLWRSSSRSHAILRCRSWVSGECPKASTQAASLGQHKWGAENPESFRFIAVAFGTTSGLGVPKGFGAGQQSGLASPLLAPSVCLATVPR
jgi:hypothetical protein